MDYYAHLGRMFFFLFFNFRLLKNVISTRTFGIYVTYVVQRTYYKWNRRCHFRRYNILFEVREVQYQGHRQPRKWKSRLFYRLQLESN